MNKDVLLDRLLWDAEQYADEYYEGLQATSLKALWLKLRTSASYQERDEGR